MLTGAQNAFREIQKVRDFSGAPEEIRTPDPQIRSLILSNSLKFPNIP
jgi:hypothetical protein